MKFYAPGKLLISGEYAVLNGAKALAIPTVGYGQKLELYDSKDETHLWQSYDPDGQWFNARFSLDLTHILEASNTSQAVSIQQVMLYIKRHNARLFDRPLHFKTILNFNRKWGFGSSSSLIALLSKWSQSPPFDLLDISFGGSGYDLAVALQDQPILYQLKSPKKMVAPIYREKQAVWQSVRFKPVFADHIFLIYRNVKQNSREAIQSYRKHLPTAHQIDQISQITESIIKCKDLPAFENLIERHEQIISTILQRPTIKQEFFSDYSGQIKSLGAWGGDFILATGLQAPNYFKSRGYATILNLKDILR